MQIVEDERINDHKGKTEEEDADKCKDLDFLRESLFVIYICTKPRYAAELGVEESEEFKVDC